jgi:hypothetical protein
VGEAKIRKRFTPEAQRHGEEKKLKIKNAKKMVMILVFDFLLSLSCPRCVSVPLG